MKIIGGVATVIVGLIIMAIPNVPLWTVVKVDNTSFGSTVGAICLIIECIVFGYIGGTTAAKFNTWFNSKFN